MSNAYGAGSPAAGLNAPGGMPPWLQNIINFVNPMTQATAGGVDAQGRPQDAITAAQQALAARALAGGPQQQGRPFAQTQVTPDMVPGANAVPTPPVSSAPLPPPGPPPSAVAALRAALTARGGSSGGGGASGSYSEPGIGSGYPVPPAVAAYVGEPGIGSGYPTPSQPIVPPNSGIGSGYPTPTAKPAGGRAVTVNPHARQQARVAAAAPQVPWITTDTRPNLPAGNGPLGRNAQTQMGMLDLSKLFNRGG